MLLLAVVVGAYLLGSVPFGFILVKLGTGQDVRQVGSGRTGGTNAWRAGGRWIGILTTLLDGFKTAACVWVAQAILPAETRYLGMALAGLSAILGHNRSVFMKFKGGAGGSPCVGGAVGLWPWSALIILPFGLFVWLGIGYASVATLSVAVGSLIVFAVRAALVKAPVEFVLYGAGAVVLLAWALRPNIQRLLHGEEKRFNWRAKRDPKPPDRFPSAG